MKFDSDITQSWIKSHSYLGLLEEENIVNDMNHMNIGKKREPAAKVW